MVTAVDTSVLLGVLPDDPSLATASGAALLLAAAEGTLVIGETVLAELVPALVAAHAQVRAQRLLARDRGYYRDDFTQLNLWDPSPP